MIQIKICIFITEIKIFQLNHNQFGRITGITDAKKEEKINE